MNSFYAGLHWLPRAPANLSEMMKTLSRATENFGRDAQTIAKHFLDLNQLTRFAKILENARRDEKSLDPLVPFRLAVLSNSTIDLLVPALIASAARRGLALEIIRSSYDQVTQEAMSPDSRINAAKPDAVLFALDHRALPLKLSLGGEQAADATVQGVISYFGALRDAIKSNCNALCIFQTVPRPSETLFGNLDVAIPGSIAGLIHSINRELCRFVAASGDLLLDVAGLAETVGLGSWHDTRQWNIGKFSFSDDYVPLYADHVARLLGAVRGKSGKVLILDLDNTVWGGVIGDDGLEGIQVAQGDPVGEAHLALQRYALELRQRGIVLAVSSKNTDEVARIPFQVHPEMILKLDHIAVFQANWNDKATNIRAIATELALGVDSMVFVDDNPVERGLVRQLLPEVWVPELPNDPAFYVRAIAAGGYFESAAFAAEDLQRAGFYQDNAKRATLQKRVGDIDAYLASLDMTITFQPFDSTGRARIIQLINKSNQFNLTTRRYTDPEIVAAEGDPRIFTLQVRLSDIFGDNGMISVIICRPGAEESWDIDTWLMSCRVLGRRVEHMVLRQILEHARASGIRKLVGRYLPTARNKLVVDHYAKLGFTKTGETESGETRWELSTDGDVPDAAPMKVVCIGFADGNLREQP